MKILTLITVLMFPFQLIIGQDSIVVSAQKTDLKTERRNQKIEERKAFVKKYVDLLNIYKVNEDCELPNFFTTTDFDKKYGGQFMLGMHGRVSLRKLIIDELNNYELMWCVMNNKDKSLRKKYTGRPKRFYLDYSKIPFEQFSTYELVDLRLDELENAKSLGNKKNE
jgi:hypothetical protein